MGDISIIARRFTDGHVQYGWSGNGGYFHNVGARLLAWYDDPDDVEYLFSLGQTRWIGKKGSERGGFRFIETHALTGEAFWLDRTERCIFSKIAFIDYGYFYDLDQKWYYVVPGPFRIKMPLRLIANHLDERAYEFTYLSEIEDKVMRYILTDFTQKNPSFQDYVEQNNGSIASIIEGIYKKGRLSMYSFFDHYEKIFNYFDDWVLIKTDADDIEVTDIIVKKKEVAHAETYSW